MSNTFKQNRIQVLKHLSYSTQIKYTFTNVPPNNQLDLLIELPSENRK